MFNGTVTEMRMLLNMNVSLPTDPGYEDGLHDGWHKAISSMVDHLAVMSLTIP